MPRHHSKSVFFDKDKTINDLVGLVKLFSWYIRKSIYSKVYFFNCINCGKHSSSAARKSKFCNNSCFRDWQKLQNRTYKTTADYYKNGTLTGVKFLSIQTFKYKSGKVAWNYLSKVSRSKDRRKEVIVYRGKDYFEACCASISALNKLEKGHEIIPFSVIKKEKPRDYSNYLNRNTSGIVGVGIYKKRNGNSINWWYRSRIYVDDKDHIVYFGHDFFEACCARKSAESRILQGTFIN